MGKPTALVVVLALGCAAGTGALADPGPPVDTTATTTTSVAPAVLADGVSIAGVDVGGLAPADALDAVRAAFAAPLTVVVAGHRTSATPEELGAVGYARRAVAAAAAAPPRGTIPLQVSVRPGPLRRYLRRLARQLNRKPVDSVLGLRDGRPFVSKEQPGLELLVEPALRAVTAALERGKRAALLVPARTLAPSVTRRGFGPVVVIHRSANQLQLFSGMRLVQSFSVATGQLAYPTPVGRFSIVVKWKNPWWYPPASPWAAGKKPTPPGPGNPLGTRWMGLSAPGVGIHGTPNSGSIGYSLSHGCIRMLIPQAEWLFDHVDVGTPVFIVAS